MPSHTFMTNERLPSKTITLKPKFILHKTNAKHFTNVKLNYKNTKFASSDNMTVINQKRKTKKCVDSSSSIKSHNKRTRLEVGKSVKGLSSISL